MLVQRNEFSRKHRYETHSAWGVAMTVRFTIAFAITFGNILAIHPCSAQQITSDVVISGASLGDGYGWSVCDDEGRLYRPPLSARPGGQGVSLMRVAKDGSTLLFTLPEPGWSIGVFAPTATGLAVLNNRYSSADGISNHMYRFDGQGKLQRERTVSIDFQPVAMAETKSGMTIVVGYRPRTGRDKEARTYGGAVLNAEDEVVTVFEFPPWATVDKWTTEHNPRMAGGDGGVNIILESGTEPKYSIATIAESGQISVLPLATVSGARSHDWFLGKGVAAEQYQFADDKPPGATKFDVFDLKSGNKIGTKTLLPAGFAVACYLGDEVSMLAHSAHVEKSSGLSPGTLRLVTIRLSE
jgi:hypothetical protein